MVIPSFSTALHKSGKPKAAARAMLSLLLFTSGFIAVQRFALSPWNSFICLLPFLAFMYYLFRRESTASITCILLALAFSIDNGGGVYYETPTAIRYSIYTSVLFTMLYFSELSVKYNALVLGCILFIGISIGTMSHLFRGDVVFSADALRRDLQVLIVIVILLLGRRSSTIDLSMLFCGGLGYLFGEIINIFFFYQSGSDYLSYESLKVFIFFPLIYSIINKKGRFFIAVLTISTLIVVFNYGARMILVSSILLFFLAYLVNHISDRSRDIVISMTVLIAVFLLIDAESLFENEWLMSMKPSAFLITAISMFSTVNFLDLLEIFDPVRFGEHIIFLDRPFVEIVFGSGIGSGIYDEKGVLDFVTSDQTAFSKKEIETSIYFNFHDFWIDFGLRFGLAPVLVLLYYFTYHAMRNVNPLFGVFLGLLLINTTFSMSGVLLTALVFRFWPKNSDIITQRLSAFSKATYV